MLPYPNPRWFARKRWKRLSCTFRVCAILQRAAQRRRWVIKFQKSVGVMLCISYTFLGALKRIRKRRHVLTIQAGIRAWKGSLDIIKKKRGIHLIYKWYQQRKAVLAHYLKLRLDQCDAESVSMAYMGHFVKLERFSTSMWVQPPESSQNAQDIVKWMKAFDDNLFSSFLPYERKICKMCSLV